MSLEFTTTQQQVIHAPLDAHIFLEGSAGTGKTCVGVARLRYLIGSGVPGGQILVMAPQRTLAAPYQELMDSAVTINGSPPTILTLGGLARRMVDLFFPLVAADYGLDPTRRPTFLSLETAQYYMARVVTPFIEQEGYFGTVSINRGRLYSQIIDNLNKAAVVGFPHTDIERRLRWAAVDEAQRQVYKQVQACATAFRGYCIAHNLLDFSLQVEVFTRALWSLEPVRAYLDKQYRHLIYENVEEDTPVAHDLIADWLSHFESALIIQDSEAGYRQFLGADSEHTDLLRGQCETNVALADSFVQSADLAALRTAFIDALVPGDEEIDTEIGIGDPQGAIWYDSYHFYTELLDGVAEQVQSLVHDMGVPPSEIVIIAPYVPDALQFALLTRLAAADVPVRTHRPSRPLRQERPVRALLSLARLAHPDWRRPPSAQDLAQALAVAVDGLDPVRAQLLVTVLYRNGALYPFAQVIPQMQTRITYGIGERYDLLFDWLHAYADDEPLALDHFWSRLFGEVLSQPGFGFHADFDAAALAADLIDSARKFRQLIQMPPVDKPFAQEYVEMMESGVIADQYLRRWQLDEAGADAVLIAPAYTFLLRNVSVAYQFWLGIGGRSWVERLYQPLTHPHVLSRRWPENMPWTDADEQAAQYEALRRLVNGLIRRCRGQIYMGFSALNERGYEQRGPLLEALDRMLRRLLGTEVLLAPLAEELAVAEDADDPFGDDYADKEGVDDDTDTE